MPTDTTSAFDAGDAGRPHVLVVDGDAERARRFAVWLAGHHVTCARRGGDALDHLRETDTDVDVAVVARRLPDMSGAAVLSSVRDRGTDVRVALVCEAGESPPVTTAAVDAVLRAPLSPADLAGTVTDLLTRRDRQRLWLELSSKRVRRNVRSLEGADVEPLDVDVERLAAAVERQADRLSTAPGGPTLADGGVADDR